VTATGSSPTNGGGLIATYRDVYRIVGKGAAREVQIAQCRYHY
jgi:hypothetical protein